MMNALTACKMLTACFLAVILSHVLIARLQTVPADERIVRSETAITDMDKRVSNLEVSNKELRDLAMKMEGRTELMLQLLMGISVGMIGLAVEATWSRLVRRRGNEPPPPAPTQGHPESLPAPSG